MNDFGKKYVWKCERCPRVVKTVHKLEKGERLSLCPKCRRQMINITPKESKIKETKETK